MRVGDGNCHELVDGQLNGVDERVF